MAHAWDFISDYETDPAELAQPELKHLAAVWQEQRERLETQDSFVRFNERLHREWAIETGLIERLYAFDRGVTQLLIEHGIDAALIPHADGQQPESVAAMIGDHQAAVESIFRFVRGERPLSTSYGNGRIARALATLVFVKALSIEPSLIRAVELWQATL